VLKSISVLPGWGTLFDEVIPMKNTLFILAIACAAFIFVLAVSAQAQTVTVLAQFDGTNGSLPYGPLIQATDGNFYGAAHSATFPYDDIFRVTPSGEISPVYNFCSLRDCADGEYTTAPILGSDGNLYGVSSGGSDYAWSGALYRLTLDGQLTILYTFCPSANCVQLEIPNGIIQGIDGNFYGTTSEGGANQAGTIFEVSSTGKFKVLHSFCAGDCAEGDGPLALPMQGSDGNFYGTAQSLEGGVVYKLTPSGTYKAIHRFCIPCFGGGNPVFSGLVQDAKGNLFGTTIYAANLDNTGTVFEITPTNQFRVLHTFRFAGGVAPGRGALTLSNDGNLYGVAVNDSFDRGGGYGIAYEVTPAGGFTSLATFHNDPNAQLLQGTDGSFYGTTVVTTYPLGDGTVFKVSTGLSPLVETVPTGGKVGSSVLILGNNLTGTSSVMFNGVAAKFTVESDTYIKATVPAGATTGTVSVVTPSGTLNSNPQFVVTK
jgi:uncharacterized repeat protein (TIGR03803 family)